jgi:hypothetical protein
MSVPEPAEALRARWRELVRTRLPRAAASRPHWPVTQDHCFARILLDNACGRPWREAIPAPAWREASPELLQQACSLGEAVLDGNADLAELNRHSLALRGKLR